MTETPAFEQLLRRDRSITIAALIVLCALAWIYILSGAGLGMSAWDMTSFALFPHRQAPEAMAGMAGARPTSMPIVDGMAGWALMIAMWWIMMIAMMTPSAAPTILLYAQVHRHAQAREMQHRGLAPTGAFAAGYALLWLAFSIAAALTAWLLARASVVPAMAGSGRAWISGSVLIGAGLYQFSPLKDACLSHCRAPASFLSRHWRPGAAGALRLGALHGAYCVGCCGLLMVLLFVGGVMNLAWIAALTLMVLVEKLLPRGAAAGRAVGACLILWGVATLLV